MRQVHVRFFVAASLLLTAVGAIGCNATGSSTIVSDGSEGGTGSPFDLPEPSGDGGTTNRGDAQSTDETVDDYDALFGPPSITTTTPDSLKGLWAGTSLNGHDMRIRFGTSSIVVALQCGSAAAVGMSVAASVSSSSIKTLESKKAGTAGSCSLSVTPDELQACTPSIYYDCFTLDGTKVELVGFMGTSSSGTFTKLSD